MGGWIKIHRSLKDWEWYDDINTSRLFLHLLLTANYEDKKWRGVLIKKGSRITGRKQLSIETGLSEQNLRTSIKRLQSTKELTITKNPKGSMFTLVNWDKYQDANQATNQEPTKAQPSANQAPTTTKETNKLNNINNYTNGDDVKDEEKSKNLDKSKNNQTKKIISDEAQEKLDEIYTENKFLEDWNKLRSEIMNKDSFQNTIRNYDAKNYFKELVKDYKREDFIKALKALFLQHKMPHGNEAMRTDPNHLLKFFERYLVAYKDQNKNLYGEKKVAERL